MGRPRKNAVVDETPVENVDVVVESPVVEAPKYKGASYSVSASFKTRTPDGDRIVHKYLGVGKSLAEALDTVVGNDEDLVDEYNKPFPRGINILVNIKVKTSEGREWERAVAPHVARDIFENKNVALANKYFS